MKREILDRAVGYSRAEEREIKSLLEAEYYNETAGGPQKMNNQAEKE